MLPKTITHPPLKPGTFRWGGGPSDHGKRPLGNWQSDNAWDLLAAPGTPIYAIGDCAVVKARASDNGRTVWGTQLTVKVDGAGEFFYTHLPMEAAAKLTVGQRFKAGQKIGVVGDSPYWVDHLHFACDPRFADVTEVVKLPWPVKPAIVVTVGGKEMIRGDRFTVAEHVKEKIVPWLGKNERIVIERR